MSSKDVPGCLAVVILGTILLVVNFLFNGGKNPMDPANKPAPEYVPVATFKKGFLTVDGKQVYSLAEMKPSLEVEGKRIAYNLEGKVFVVFDVTMEGVLTNFPASIEPRRYKVVWTETDPRE